MPVFDEVHGRVTLCAATFRDSVHDSFGASVIADVLDPILVELASLRAFDTEFWQRAHDIDRVLEEARAIQCKKGENLE